MRPTAWFIWNTVSDTKDCTVVIVFPLKSMSILLQKNDDKAKNKQTKKPKSKKNKNKIKQNNTEFQWSWQYRYLAVFFMIYIKSIVWMIFSSFINESFLLPYSFTVWIIIHHRIHLGKRLHEHNRNMKCCNISQEFTVY